MTTDFDPDAVANEIGLESLSTKNGAIDMKFVSNGDNSEHVMLAMSDAMGDMLDKHDATNYVEFTLQKRGKPTYDVCVRRHHRPTPHELRQEAEAKLEAARTAMSKLMDKLDETTDGLGDWHDATEYLTWARSEVRDAWLAAGGGQ